MDNQKDDPETIDGMLIRSEEIGFAASEMLPCAKCTRNNAPNRLECIYCGAELRSGDQSDAELLKARIAEDWEPAVNVIFSGLDRNEEGRPAKDAGVTGFIHADLLAEAIRLDPPIPLVRMASEPEADQIANRLRSIGINTAIVTDRELDIGAPPIRIRNMAVGVNDIELTLFNTSETIRFNISDLALIVAAQLTEENVEATISKKKKELKRTDERSAFSDSGVIDLYFRVHKQGFRIMAHGFDFSVLGVSKQPFAGANMVLLAELLQKVSADARFIDDYREKRSILDVAWPLARRNTSKGVQRTGVRISVSKGESISNAEQFTKYSRLLRRFVCPEGRE